MANLTFNNNPYFDDFDESKNFHKILFKPGVSVQARELTQLQTILQDQIKKFGNHIFRHGSVVIPGNSLSDLSAPYVKLSILSSTQTGFDMFTLEGKEIVGAITGIKAIIKKIVLANGSDPATLYISYRTGGTDPDSPASVFSEDEILSVTGDVTTNIVTALENATGYGSLAHINDGVFYVNGNFVSVFKQTLVISKYSQAPSCHVLLRINESIIDSDADESLLDPAQGTYNYAAPGADRHKISLELTSLPLNSTISEDYIELMRYNNGVLEEHARYPKYNELEKSLARRTYDESGDYIVNGLDLNIREHRKSGLNNGVYPEESGGDANKFIVEVNPGKAYIRGFENEQIAQSQIILDKGRTSDHIKSSDNITLNPKYSQYIYVSNLIDLPDVKTNESLTLKNSAGATIGSTLVLAIDLHEPSDSGSPELNIYKFFITKLVFQGGNKITDVATISYASSGYGRVVHKLIIPTSGASFQKNDILENIAGRTGKVVLYIKSFSTMYINKLIDSENASNALPMAGDEIYKTSSGARGVITSVESSGTYEGTSAIFKLPFNSTYSVRAPGGVADAEYKVYKQVSVVISGGSGTATIVGASIDTYEQGNMIFVHPVEGVIPITSSNIVIQSENTFDIIGVPVQYDGTVNAIISCTKKNQVNKFKTLTTQIDTFTVPPSYTYINLYKCDVYKIISVVSSVNGDVTNRFTFNTGQTDYSYRNGYLKLIGTAAPPSGVITVTYSYFQHSGSGDFFTIDSYVNSGLGSDYYDAIPDYISETDGKIYKLQNCLDFRRRNNYLQVADSSTVDLVQIGSRIITSVQYYVPRIDLVIMDKSGKISQVPGIPSENPVPPQRPEGSILLGTLTVPEYTYFIKDIKNEKPKNKVYTMANISAIEDRIYNLEQYSLLSQSEKTLIDSDIIDAATGLSRYKSGYLVDTFDNPDIISDVFDPEFSATYLDNHLLPKVEINEVTIDVFDTTLIWNKFATLNYTEVVFAEQKLSSRITNVNPFAVYNWTGNMNLFPSSDSWVETENLPTIFNETITNNVVDVKVRRPWNWQPTPEDLLVSYTAPSPVVVPSTTTTSTQANAPTLGVEKYTPPGNGCFIAGTKIEMADGTLRSIEDIKIGDYVKNHTGEKFNSVAFIEVIKNNSLELFSPQSGIKPFITVNHPIFINGKLHAFVEGINYENWLGPMQILDRNNLNMSFTPSSGEIVYNIWVSGDRTFIANGIGTHSIMMHDSWIVKQFNSNELTVDDISNIMGECSLNKNRQLGAVLVNEYIKDWNIKLFDKCLSKILKSTGVLKKITFTIFEIIGNNFKNK